MEDKVLRDMFPGNCSDDQRRKKKLPFFFFFWPEIKLNTPLSAIMSSRILKHGREAV